MYYVYLVYAVGQQVYYASKLVNNVVRGDQPPPPDTSDELFESLEEMHPLTELTRHWNSFTSQRRG